MPLSEHVYCVAVTFKMTEWVEQQICIKFCVKLEHSSTETIRMIQKAEAIGNCRLAASWQHTCSCITSHAEFFWETSNYPCDVAPITAQIWHPVTLVFPKTKITFEREEISDCQWDSGKYNRVADGDWENCVRSQGAYFEGNWGIIVLCTVFLVSFSVKCLSFSYSMYGYFLDRPHISEIFSDNYDNIIIIIQVYGFTVTHYLFFYELILRFFLFLVITNNIAAKIYILVFI